MDVVIIGTGHVASILGRELIHKGHRILSIWGRDHERAALLAKEWGTVAVTKLHDLPQRADMFLLAVSDRAIGELAAQLTQREGMLVHHAGAVSANVLLGTGSYGVLWPIKMLKKDMSGLDNCTLVIDANDAAGLEKLRTLAASLSTHVVEANDETRLRMHMIAAVTSNLTNHLYHLAADYCAAESMDLAWFYPIIQTTASQVQHAHPAKVQAGPAFRGDEETLAKHRSVLTGHPDLLHLYNEISASIRKHFE